MCPPSGHVLCAACVLQGVSGAAGERGAENQVPLKEDGSDDTIKKPSERLHMQRDREGSGTQAQPGFCSRAAGSRHGCSAEERGDPANAWASSSPVPLLNQPCDAQEAHFSDEAAEAQRREGSVPRVSTWRNAQAKLERSMPDPAPLPPCSARSVCWWTVLPTWKDSAPHLLTPGPTSLGPTGPCH